MTRAYRISQIYDIATAFITDARTKLDTKKTGNAIKYTFTKNISPETAYTLTIVLPIGEVIKPEPGVRDWEVNYKQGVITLKSGDNLLMFAQTRHSVGRAADIRTSDIQKLWTRIKSPKFFQLIDMANKRTRGQVQLMDNSAQIFNITYRLKELQR